MQPQPRTLVIMAAGIGSRFKGLKQLKRLSLFGRTLIDYSLEDAHKAGFTRIVFIIRRETETQFERKISSAWRRNFTIDYVHQERDRLPCRIEIPVERKKPWGTAHAIWCARDAVTSSFVVMNADDYYGFSSLKTIGDFLQGIPHQESRHALVAFRLNQTLSPFGTVTRGVCEVAPGGMLQKITEYRGVNEKDSQIYSNGRIIQGLQPDNPVSMNLWGFAPTIFPFLEEALAKFLTAKTTRLAEEECLLPEVINGGIQEQKLSVQVLSTTDRWAGLTYREDLKWVKKVMAEDRH